MKGGRAFSGCGVFLALLAFAGPARAEEKKCPPGSVLKGSHCEKLAPDPNAPGDSSAPVISQVELRKPVYVPPPGAKSYQIPWACPVAPVSASQSGALPERKLFTVYYTTDPQVVDLTEIKQFLAGAAASGDLAYGACADNFFMSCLITSYDLCQKEAKDAGKSDDDAKEACMKDKPGDIHDQMIKLTRAVKDHDKAGPHRPPFLPMGKIPQPPLMQEPERLHITQGLAKNISANCAARSFIDIGTTPGMVDAVAFSRDFIEGPLAKEILPKVSEACREKIVSSYLDTLAWMQPPSAVCQVTPVPEPCRLVRDATAKAVLALQAAVPASKLKTALGYSGNLETCLKNSKDPEAFLRELILDAGFASACVALGDGESGVVDKMDYSQTGFAPASYKLTHQGKKFNAQVNIAFKPQTPKALGDKMRAKAAGCLKEASGMMAGPDQQSLAISIYDGKAPENSSDTEPPPAHEVLITPSKEQKELEAKAKAEGKPFGFREHSGNWGENSDCHTIVHETLHLLGLIDEYEETQIGFNYDDSTGKFSKDTETDADKAAYDCRSLGPPDSIMSNDALAYEKFKKGKRKSILMVGQFSAITQPGCTVKNKLYMQCARPAYTTSEDHGGEGCPKLPADCKKPEKWLGGYL